MQHQELNAGIAYFLTDVVQGVGQSEGGCFTF